ncbi:5'-nucleotidase SurE [Piscirickettsia salmonis]|uniref:5'-nucleotidase SurE n=1 Tax=Piscirickettsia salmonis TaxID=1238 RepID=A0A1L6TBC3_PISSA|nr:5'/3'-nucleotidase SurE [Piscirickettsia salmonis]AKP73823.1 stationary phase survival protein SurE [Piscirickettsia salmonis LF-89 = ATCC VR-1361]ALB22629.1 5'/3'-nucleotidase SurE [Piscirickettsia salmonis]ALY02644.1 stationary phase survival protein SurE [Piscirickettsia salmonis]AMA42187.1 stationary phase survival protein SurE [Piscirickettsia salmonis]AOS34664.1 stationary phase survival protein SurE [Piscirickettsia salmonis]
MLKILLSNDDGVYARGLIEMYQALASIATVYVVAPDRDCSGKSNCITLDRPLSIQKADNGFLKVNGTPVDCVHLALNEVYKGEEIDLVISGINAGGNMADDTIYSGTVAAAMEGRRHGVPAIAVSLKGEGCLDNYSTAASFVAGLVEKIIKDPLPADTILNVNVPDLPQEQIKGVQVTRLGQRHRAQAVIPAENPRGYPMFWIGPVGPEQDAGVGTDFFALRENQISITPLKTDLTQFEAMETVAHWNALRLEASDD